MSVSSSRGAGCSDTGGLSGDPRAAGDAPAARSSDAGSKERPGISIVGLALISSVGAFGTHLLLPALPAIREDFGVTGAQAQLVVSLSLLALAAGALVNGPLSDRYGRRPVARFGLLLYVLGSLVAWLAPDLWSLLAGRVIQAVGGGAAITVVRALIRDLYDRDTAASVHGYMASVVLVVPMLVPFLGGVLTDFIGWRSNFIAAAAVGVGVSLFVMLRLPETRGHRDGHAHRIGMLPSLGVLARNRIFVGFALTYACSMGATQAFISGAPLVVIGTLGLSPSEYGLWYMISAAASLTGFWLAGRYSSRRGVHAMIATALPVSLAATVAVLSVGVASGYSPLLFFIPAMWHTFANALIVPNATSGAISARPDIAGAAAGLLGFVQFVLSAIAAQLAGVLQDRLEYGVALVMLAFSVAAALSYLLLARPAARRGKQPGGAAQ